MPETTPQRPGRTARWLAGLGALALFALAAYAGALGFASVYADAGGYYLARWTGSEPLKNPDPVTWGKALDALSTAARLRPFDPDVLTDLGRLYEWRVIERDPGDPDARADRERALAYYRQAVRLRPSYPYDWANVVTAKANLADVDPELLRALERATTLGPWESRVLHVVVSVGLAYRERLPPETRALVDGALERGVAAGVPSIVAMRGYDPAAASPPPPPALPRAQPPVPSLAPVPPPRQGQVPAGPPALPAAAPPAAASSPGPDRVSAPALASPPHPGAVAAPEPRPPGASR